MVNIIHTIIIIMQIKIILNYKERKIVRIINISIL